MVSLSFSGLLLASGFSYFTFTSTVYAQTSDGRTDTASLMPSQTEKKVLVGYLHNGAIGTNGYRLGISSKVPLSVISIDYNVVNVSCMKVDKSNRIPTFVPDGLSDKDFRTEVAKLNAEGRSILIDLGAVDAHIELKKGIKML